MKLPSQGQGAPGCSPEKLIVYERPELLTAEPSKRAKLITLEAEVTVKLLGLAVEPGNKSGAVKLKTGGAVSTKMAVAGPVALSCKPSMCPVVVPVPEPPKVELTLTA